MSINDLVAIKENDRLSILKNEAIEFTQKALADFIEYKDGEGCELIMEKKFGNAFESTSTHILEVYIHSDSERLNLLILSEENDDQELFIGIGINFEKEALIALFEYKKATKFTQIIPVLTPVLQSFAITSLIEKACFSLQPECMANENFFTQTGMFEISRKRGKIFILRFVPKAKFSRWMFVAKEAFFTQEAFGGLFPYYLTKGW